MESARATLCVLGVGVPQPQWGSLGVLEGWQASMASTSPREHLAGDQGYNLLRGPWRAGQPPNQGSRSPTIHFLAPQRQASHKGVLWFDS